MWPGQQPPGGEQNPQDQNQNPYQQPGYQQPNPYQQPGYQQPGQQPGYQQPGQPGYPQPNPYQQPTVSQYAVPGQPGPPQGDDKKKTTIIAIVAAAAVVVTAVVTGVVVLGKDDEKSGKNVADGKKPSASAKPSEATSAPVDNPRDGSDAKPLIPGWKVVTNPKWGTQFDVPGDWEVASSGMISGFENVKNPEGPPAVGFSAPAFYKSKWCIDDADKDGTKEDTSLAGVGTKGAQGAKSTDEAAGIAADNWSWAPYAQEEPKGTVKVGKAKPYTTKSGLSGSVVTATAANVKKNEKCDTDGKSIAFSFLNAKKEYAIWVLHANAGVKDELPDTTIQQILSTVRLAGSST